MEPVYELWVISTSAEGFTGEEKLMVCLDDAEADAFCEVFSSVFPDNSFKVLEAL